jgi:hypothetical protein
MRRTERIVWLILAVLVAGVLYATCVVFGQ